MYGMPIKARLGLIGLVQTNVLHVLSDKLNTIEDTNQTL